MRSASHLFRSQAPQAFARCCISRATIAAASSFAVLARHTASRSQHTFPTRYVVAASLVARFYAESMSLKRVDCSQLNWNRDTHCSSSHHHSSSSSHSDTKEDSQPVPRIHWQHCRGSSLCVSEQTQCQSTVRISWCHYLARSRSTLRSPEGPEIRAAQT